VESLLGEAEVSSLEIRVPVRKRHNFCSDRWIALKCLQELPDTVFLVVDVQSLLGEAEISSLETRVPVRRAITFDPTVGSHSNFYSCFRTPFSL
jgi:hypothetical protein